MQNASHHNVKTALGRSPVEGHRSGTHSSFDVCVFSHFNVVVAVFQLFDLIFVLIGYLA